VYLPDAYLEAEIELNVNLDTWDTSWESQYGDVEQDHDIHDVFNGVATVKFSDDLKPMFRPPRRAFALQVRLCFRFAKR